MIICVPLLALVGFMGTISFSTSMLFFCLYYYFCYSLCQALLFCVKIIEVSSALLFIYGF